MLLGCYGFLDIIRLLLDFSQLIAAEYFLVAA